MREDVVKQIRAKTQRLATLPSSDTIVQQMPLKPAVFHGLSKKSPSSLSRRKHLACVFSAQEGWERLQLHWALSNSLSSRHGFYPKTLSGFLALKLHRQLSSSKSFPPNCSSLRWLAILSHIAILVTMRGRCPPCDEAINWQSKEIQPTDEGASLRIYVASIQIRRMILMSVDCWVYWDTCLLLSHLWRDWARKDSQQRRS